MFNKELAYSLPTKRDQHPRDLAMKVMGSCVDFPDPPTMAKVGCGLSEEKGEKWLLLSLQKSHVIWAWDFCSHLFFSLVGLLKSCVFKRELALFIYVKKMYWFCKSCSICFEFEITTVGLRMIYVWRASATLHSTVLCTKWFLTINQSRICP